MQKGRNAAFFLWQCSDLQSVIALHVTVHHRIPQMLDDGDRHRTGTRHLLRHRAQQRTAERPMALGADTTMSAPLRSAMSTSVGRVAQANVGFRPRQPPPARPGRAPAGVHQPPRWLQRSGRVPAGHQLVQRRRLLHMGQHHRGLQPLLQPLQRAAHRRATNSEPSTATRILSMLFSLCGLLTRPVVTPAGCTSTLRKGPPNRPGRCLGQSRPCFSSTFSKQTLQPREARQAHAQPRRGADPIFMPVGTYGTVRA